MDNNIEDYKAVIESDVLVASSKKNTYEEDQDQRKLTVEQAVLNRPRRAGAGTGINRLELNLHGKSYNKVRRKQFVMKGDRIEIIQKLVQAIFTQMQATKGIKNTERRQWLPCLKN